MHVHVQVLDLPQLTELVQALLKPDPNDEEAPPPELPPTAVHYVLRGLVRGVFLVANFPRLWCPNTRRSRSPDPRPSLRSPHPLTRPQSRPPLSTTAGTQTRRQVSLSTLRSGRRSSRPTARHSSA